jgi:hypothetical protein
MVKSLFMEKSKNGKNWSKNAGAEIPNVVSLFEGDHHDCSPVEQSHLLLLWHFHGIVFLLASER